MKTCEVRYGYGDPAKLAQWEPDYCANDLGEWVHLGAIDHLEPGHSLAEFLPQFPAVSREIAIRALEGMAARQNRVLNGDVQGSSTMGAGWQMAIETTYTQLRAHLASILDQVVDQQETVVVRRKGTRDVALVPADELAGLLETAHLLRSPRNARRLLTALRRAERGKSKPANVADLRREMLGGSGR